MAQGISVEVEERVATGKNANRALRRQERIPGVVYGLARPSFLVGVDPKKVEEILHTESGKNSILNLSLAGQDRSRAVMIKELQRDPVTGEPLHVDFIRVDLKKKIVVSVPVRVVGTPTGVKNEGGMLDFVHRQVELECLPEDIPEHLDVDVSELHINQHVAVADLEPTERFRVLDAPESIIAVVAPPRVEEAPPAEEVPEAEEEGEPEVMKKGKETGEEGTESKEGGPSGSS